jgi:hypothetical protein
MTQRLLNRVVEVKGKEDGEREPRGEDGAQIHVDRRLPDQYIQIRQYKSMIGTLWIEIGGCCRIAENRGERDHE